MEHDSESGTELSVSNGTPADDPGEGVRSVDTDENDVTRSERAVETVGADEAPSAIVIETVSHLEGVDPVELTPLQNVVDCESLDALFRDSPVADPNTDVGENRVSVRFQYAGYDVTVVPGSVIVSAQEN